MPTQKLFCAFMVLIATLAISKTAGHFPGLTTFSESHRPNSSSPAETEGHSTTLMSPGEDLQGAGHMEPRLSSLGWDALGMGKEVALTDACANSCARGHDVEDLKFHEEMDLGPAHGLLSVCIIRCRTGLKNPREIGYAEATSNPSTVLRKYFTCAQKCKYSTHGFDISRQHAEALESLTACGTVRLNNVFSLSFLHEVAQAVSLLRTGAFQGTSLNELRCNNTLRESREEIWAPFVPPFSDKRLLHVETLMNLVDNYFDAHSDKITHTVLTHVNIIVSKHGVAKAQALHSDVPSTGTFLNVHIPLQAVNLSMGPTRMCPCTQQKMARSKAGISDEETGATLDSVANFLNLFRSNHDVNFCEDFEDLHYEAETEFGEVTVYDGSVLHKGSANHATVDRPLLVLTFAASEKHAQERNYTGNAVMREGLPEVGVEAHKFEHDFNTWREGTLPH